LLSFEKWLAHAMRLDDGARRAEIANLPRTAFPIDGAADARAASERSARCRAAWPAKLGLAPAASGTAASPVAASRTNDAREALLAHATVPDRYSLALRTAGLYPLVRWPFLAGVRAWQQRQSAQVARWAEAPPTLQRFAVDDDRVPLVFEIERSGADSLAPFDRFGTPAWQADPNASLQVDTSKPVIYRRSGLALVDGRMLHQDVFTLWFPERPASDAFDLLAGSLDAVIVRLTYTPDGRVWVLDSIHGCGCYHMFFPAAGVRLRDGAPRHEEWAFVPAQLPPLGPSERLSVRIASGSHYVSGIGRVAAAAPGARVALRDENELRSLPRPDGSRRSLYGPDGLVHGSERAERFLFWPMGIASAGAMRQWGHHATAFVGRRHFDDPNLLAQRFVLPGTPPP
jgi:hypothetical protein